MKEHVERHIQYVHHCDTCSKVFNTRSTLRHHRYSCAYRVTEKVSQPGNEKDLMLKGFKKEILRSISNEVLEDCSKNNLMAELDAKVKSLIVKVEGGTWGCAVCAYTSAKNHVKEHVEKHIDGYSHPCQTCERVFKMRVYLHQHRTKCSKEIKLTF